MDKKRVRARLKGPRRLTVHRTGFHISAQITENGKTLVSFSSLEDRSIKGYGIDGATKVGESLGKKAKQKGIDTVVFDRGQHIYHGRIKALAEGARKYVRF